MQEIIDYSCDCGREKTAIPTSIMECVCGQAMHRVIPISIQPIESPLISPPATDKQRL